MMVINADIARKKYPVLVFDKLNKMMLIPQQMITSEVFTFIVAPSERKLRSSNELKNQPLKPIRPNIMAAAAKITADCFQGYCLTAVGSNRDI